MEEKNGMNNLPLELAYDILSRLTVKEILCFKCVSKRWHAETSSKGFIEFHHRRQALKKILDTSFILFGWTTIVSFNLVSNVEKLPDSGFCFFNFGGTPRIVGSCNGLLCYQEEFLRFSLYNPITKVYRVLPEILGTCFSFPVFAFRDTSGFGYDCNSKDYKILRIVHSKRFQGQDENLAYIYSLRTDSWKVNQSIPPGQGFDSNGQYMPFCNNSLHWKTYQSNGTVALISGFNLGTEEYHEVLLPPGKISHNWELASLRGCLHVVDGEWSCQLDIWIMKEYGVQQSWLKLFHCNDFGHVFRDNQHRFWKPDGRPMTYSYSEDGTEILVGSVDLPKNFVGCNLQSQCMRSFELKGLPENNGFGLQVMPWVASLESPYLE